MFMPAKHGMTGQRNAAKNKGYNGRLNVQTVLGNKLKWQEHVISIKKIKPSGYVFTDWINEAAAEKFERETHLREIGNE